MIKKFGEAGSIVGSKLHLVHRTDRSVHNNAAVDESVALSPGTSLRPLFTTIGHSEKNHAANSQERSASACLQDSTDVRNQPNGPCTSPRIC